MKLIWTEEELQQGSAEWLLWRKGIVGAGEEGAAELTLGGSEIAPLMYLSPYATPFDLYQQKMGLVQKEFSPYAIKVMNRGTFLEPFARKFYEKGNYFLWNGNKYEPVDRDEVVTRQLCAIHPEKLWMRTSLDGLTEDNATVLEIKSPASLDNHTKQTKDGIVPAYRYPQLQWQIAVMREHFEGVEKVDYISFYKEIKNEPEDLLNPPEGWEPEFGFTDMKVIPVAPNEEFIQEIIRRAEIFIEHLREQRPPAPTLFIEDLPITAVYPTPRVKKTAVPAFF